MRKNVFPLSSVVYIGAFAVTALSLTARKRTPASTDENAPVIHDAEETPANNS